MSKLDTLQAALGSVLGERVKTLVRGHGDRDLTAVANEFFYSRAKCGFERRLKGIELAHARAIVFSRRIFACSCSTPYSNASAVGGQPGT